MKIAVYNYREFDEGAYFEKFSKIYNVEIVRIDDAPDLQNANLAKGCFGVSVITTAITKDIIQTWSHLGIKHISTRTIGYDHIDLESAKDLGMTVSNVTYSTASVANYTVMLILMALRKMKMVMRRAVGFDYSLENSIGMELENKTVGVVGTGAIGQKVIQNLSGFGCKIIATDPFIKKEVTKYAQYVSLEKLIKESDIITFHVPALEDTYHIVRQETIDQMKDGVILVNTARGSVINTTDLIKNLENGKIGACALDVIENELGLYYQDYKYQVIGNHELSILRDMPNVLLTPHLAFYTEQAVSDMVENSIASIVASFNGEENKFKIC
ncbi:D-isomer specific 2-hydroxyacid dehydrogenase family protein [Erysipelatoclostridium sp. An173]|uniref:D-isomer specific 2-hydroxyacid dehydrogenase family protein n=1 Tax=Erysipelatoclostridium sp. An173 TaxID=1965571 RepID=UPI000B3686A7|nr:D-isomer specific 2-hydroxyacid dehydrogenase family protein [Erysipelatoclostridium sp. An173]OUP77951.1 lactate dehydrogenase [Erysipelatoclostridium sp. An173]